MTGILDALACASDPFTCAVNWLDTISALVLITVSFAIGAIVGSHLGKKVVYSILTLGVVALFLDKRQPSDTHEHVQGKDAAPAFRARKFRAGKVLTFDADPPKKPGKTLAQRAIEGE